MVRGTMRGIRRGVFPIHQGVEVHRGGAGVRLNFWLGARPTASLQL